MKEKRETDQNTKVRMTNLEKEEKVKPDLKADSAQQTEVLDLHPLGLV